MDTIYLQAEDLTIIPDGNTSTTDDTLVRTRTANQERTQSQLPEAGFDEYGLRNGYTGEGYFDINGTTTGVRATFELNLPAGTYDIHLRVANGATGTATSAAFNRPIAIAVDGQQQGAAQNTNTGGFDIWQVRTFQVTLTGDGPHTIGIMQMSGAGQYAPNIDVIAVTDPGKTETFDALTDFSADADGNLAVIPVDSILNSTEVGAAEFRLYGVDADSTTFEISFDGGTTRTPVTAVDEGNGTYLVTVSAADVPAGSAQATVFITDDAGNEVQKAVGFTILADNGAARVSLVIQAEDSASVTVQDTGVNTNGDFTRVVDAANPDAFGNFRTGAVGGAYMDFGSNTGDAITVNVNAPVAGTYLVTFRYANGGDADRPLNLSLNGAEPMSVSFLPGPIVGTGTTANAWSSWVEKTVELDLAAGANTIQLSIPAGINNGPNIDQITLDLFEAAAVPDTTADEGDDLSFTGPSEAVSTEAAGAVVFGVAGLDGDIVKVEASLDGGLSRIEVPVTNGQVTLDLSALPEGPATIAFYATDAAGNVATESITVTMAAAPDTGAGPVSVTFENVTSYAGSQDSPFGAPGFVVSDNGATLALNDNLWKRVALTEGYAITADTKIVLDLAIGANMPEIVAVGFDLDENAFDGDRSIYQLGGSQTQAGFIDLRSSGQPNENGTVRYTIDLGAHAGTTINSLVFISDDDTRTPLGSATFSNVQLVESVDETPGNVAPEVVGGGIADIVVSEGGAVEIDLPFVDRNNDPLTYAFTITKDGAGVPGVDGLSISGNVLSGTVSGLDVGAYVITVSASDGTETTSTSFDLTVENVNDAPVAADVALEPYFGEAGQAFDGLDLGSLRGFFSDPDGDELTLSVEGLPEGLSVNEEGVIVGTPTEAGAFSVIVRATDAGGLSDTITLQFNIDGPTVGDVVSVEAEAFTGLASATNFYMTAAAPASGSQLIRLNDNQSGEVSTNLGANGLTAGWYMVSVVAFDETDGQGTLSLKIGDTVLQARNTATDELTGTVVLNDQFGSFLNGGTRGNAAQTGNLKSIAFETPVFIDAQTIATLSAQTNAGEVMRIDRLVFTRIEEPVNAAPAIGGLAEAIAIDENGTSVATVTISDPENDAVTVTLEGADAALFSYDQETGALSFVSAPDAEAPADSDGNGSYEVTVSVNDGSNTVSQNVVVTVADINESIAIGETAFSVAEGSTAAGSVSLTDEDGGSAGLASPVFAITGGADADRFVIDAATGALSFKDSPDYEAPVDADGNNAYEVEVTATDGGLEDVKTATVTVTNVDEAAFTPITIQAEAGSISLIGDAVTTDDDTMVRDPDNPENNPALPNGLRPGFTGTGYLDFGNDAGDTVTYTVTVAQAGQYDLNVRYASQAFAGAPRALDIGINGASLGTTTFPDTGPSSGPTELQGFNVWQLLTQTVTLTAGVNTITFAIPAGATAGPNLDRIEITQAGTGPIGSDTSADEDGNLFLDAPDGELNEAGAASINFNIAGVDADVTKVEISFDGGVTRTDITGLPDADGDFVFDGSALPPGVTTVTVIVTDEAGNEAEATADVTIAGATAAPFTIQAEDAASVTVQDTGVPTNGDFTRVVDQANPDAFGNYRTGAVDGAYMDFGSNPGDAITINVNAPAAGTYLVTFRYANGGATDRPLDLSLNGGAATSVSFVPGPVVGTGADATAWNSWVEKTVELNLSAGANAIKLAIPAGGNNGPNIDQITFAPQNGGPTDPEPFTLTIEAETFTPVDTSGTGNQITQGRTADNPEPNAPLARDANSDGLWDGFTGAGYLDMGAQVGDAATFTVNAPEAGTYTFTFRYSNGGGGTNGDRPMSLTVGGQTKTVSFPGTGVDGWDNWQTATVEVQLSAGVNTVSIANTVTNGPNIDNVTISRDTQGPVDPREQMTFQEVVKINFEPAPSQTTQGLPTGYSTPTGYLADIGAAFGDRGNGFSYGWVTEASVADGTANGTIAAAQPANAHWYKSTVTGASDLQKTYAHFEYPGAGVSGSRAWEMSLANGTYQVTMSVGDTAGAFDSNYVVDVEGQRFGQSWVPANPVDGSLSGGGFRSTLVTGIVHVTDGRLTIDSIGGTNTEIQYLEVERVPDLTPNDDRPADLDYSYFTSPVAAYLNDQVPISIGSDGALPVGINPLSSLVVGVNVQAPNHRGPNIAHVENIKLVETLTGQEVAIDVQISGGADSLTIRPLQPLKENTSYTLKVQDVLDLGSITDGTAPLHQMQDMTTTFVTGEAPEEVARDVAFTTQTLLDGFADGAGGYTSIEFGPDGKLYVATITGEIYRWAVNADGTIDKASQESLIHEYFAQADGDRRGIVGFTFDPEDPNTIWISNNYAIPRENKAFDTPEFSGRISKITLGPNGSFTGATIETYIDGLPRSGGDHLTNSLEFRVNPNAGQAGEPNYLLYVSQGSNSAAGAADNAWGNRPERLLNAAVLEIDPTRDAPPGGFNVRTEPVTAPTTVNPAANFNADGTYPGFYNPYAADAVLKIFATGVRNAYDLVWHSNGQLYMPTNGTASGGKTPDDPTQAGSQVINNSPKQYDYFFTVEEGKYYGHPNVLRDEYVLNGGNPTGGIDPNEVTDGKDGNPNTDGYDPGVQPDPNYDLDGTYNLGYNQSPNGAIEYKGAAFGSNLKGAILFAQFSAGDNVRAILVDQQGNIVGDDVLRRPDGSVINNYIDPLDIIENPVTGQLYLMTLNRGTGASQLVLLTPAPGGVTQDLTADEGGNLALTVVDVSDPASAIFQIGGLDTDITAIRISFNGGAPQTVLLDSQNRFTVDLGDLTGPVTAQIEVTDDALNRATASATFTPGQEPNPQPTDLVSLVTIQAEDNTPGDGTSVSIPGAPAEIQIRTAANPETGTSGLVGGLRPGAFGLDGNTNNADGVPGGYADFGASNADFLTFNFEVPSDQAGAGVVKVRYGNGGTTDRPLEVFVNGASIGTFGFSPPAGVTGDAAWATWQTLDIPMNLVAGLNTVTFRATANTGPNIDQIEVLVPPVTQQPTEFSFYEAENATLNGAVVVTENRNQEGTGFVDFNGTTDQSITWTVNSAQAGAFEIAFRYALAASKADRPLNLTVNGVDLGPINFEGFSNDAETEWQFQSTMVNLVAGNNTITLTAPNAVGPNIDQLRVANAGTTPFDPDYVAVTGETRIELEQTADNSTRTLNSQAVEFFFTVAEDGTYALDLAANAGAPNGQGLTLYLNGVIVENLAFPGTGTAGESTAFLQLEAGTQYQLRVVSNAPGASAIDYLDVRPVASDVNADIAIQSLDPAYFDNRLHFSYLEDPNAVDPNAADRDFKDSGTIRITNTGTAPLSVIDAEITGPFVLANPAIFEGLTLAAGQSIEVTVLFNRAAYTPPTSNVDATSTVFEGSIRLVTNDADTPVSTIDLAGFWQSRDEGGHEPNVNEVWKIFGFGNVIEGLTTRGGGENSTLSTNDVFAKTDPTEVLSPYWKLADGVTEAKITHIAAFHGTGGATIHLHNPNNKGSNIQLWNHEGTDNQRLLPNAGNDSTFATRTFTRNDIPDGWTGNDMFGISVAGLSTDPRLNPTGGVVVPGAQQGHTVKMFQALDANGNVIPNVYLGIMDYTGINYDYNDNMFVIEGVAPVGFGQSVVLRGLDDAAADERLVFTNIENPVNASQAFRNEATFTITNDGFAPLTIESITTGNPAFEIVGTAPTSIAAGASATVTVRFIGTHAGTGSGADLYKSTLTIRSNDVNQPEKVIQLAGLAQEFSENNSEPTVAQIVEAFGYGTDVAQGELAGGGVVETIGDEVLLPYLQRLDGTKPIEVIQLAAFLNQGNVARLGFHGLESSQVTQLFANDDQQGQTILPDQLLAGAGSGANVARATINHNNPFGLYISVDGRPTYASWSDPEANKIDPNFGHLVGDNQGHLIRFFQALDANGNAIEGTYIGIQDYPGAGNYDYNDHMFVIKNVKGYDLTTANDANNNDVNDALELDADADGTVNFFDPTTNPDPGDGGLEKGDYVTGVNFGGGAIANDPVLGVALQAQSSISVTGSVNPAAGTDSASNPNGANAVAGSAFKTYEDGTSWNAAINVANGTYVVVLHTQETYWNQAGMRQFDISVNGSLVADDLDVFAEVGGDTPYAVETLVTVTNGVISIALDSTGPDGIDNAALNAVTVYKYAGAGGGGQTPFTGTAIAVGADPIVIDATKFDLGGQGVAYNDTTPTTDEGGTAGRNEGVDIVGNNSAIGWIANGEWVEYTINVAQAGTYDLSFLSALGAQGGTARSITATFEKGGTVYETATPVGVGFTGGWSTFQQTGKVQVDLEAGVQTVRLAFSGGSMDLKSFTLDKTNVAPVVGQAVGAQTATQGQTFNFALPANTFTDSDGDALTYTASGLPQGLSITPAGVISGTPAAAGTFDITVTASDGAASAATTFNLTVAPPTSTPTQQPYGGTAPSFVNGSLTVDASNFDQGGQGVAYNDNAGKDGGTGFRPGDAVEFVGAQNDIGYVRPGEWVEYTVNVPQSGTYKLSLMAKTPLGNATVAVSLGNGTPLATVALQDGGTSFGNAPFQATAPVELTLPAGQQTIRLAFNGTPEGSSPYILDLRSFTFDYVPPPANQQAPFSGTAIAVGADPVLVDATKFDLGGQGVAYNDTTPTTDEGGTAGRNEGVDIVGNNSAIGWIANGEWVEYTINVAQAGTYDLSFLSALGAQGGTARSITATFEKGGTVYETATPVGVGFTGGWSTFQQTGKVQVDLEAGVQTVR
ncbi:carbohydrate-binding protein, partial [Microvirga lenta]|uniref:carbohydrate-binding protein n=1 Tax=Microvirga lenta TaxID=2881337 RepID=UPI001CFF5E38